MKIYENGIVREMTPTEIAEIEAGQAEMSVQDPTPHERITALEEELRAAKILLGVDA